MPEIHVSSLDPRVQKQVENAQIALQRGNLDYVVEVCAQVLKTAPGCLPVRRLQRAAQLRRFQSKNKLLSKAFGSVTTAGIFFGGKKDPGKSLENAEKMLATDPTSIPALKLLAEAAASLELKETAAFAWEAIRDLQPGDRDTLLTLGESYIAAGKPREALATADNILKLRPQDGDALALMRKASVAQTMDKGNWEAQGSFRDKLRDEQQAVSLEQAAKVVTSEEMTQRLVSEALDRVCREPSNLNHYRTLVDGYRKLGQLDDAIAWVRKARQQPAGAADGALERLETDLQTAALEQRVKDLAAALATHPDDATLKTQHADAVHALNAFRIKEARAYVERYPNDYAARFTLANLYFENGDFQSAIANYQQAQKNPKVRIAALVGMGKSLKARRMFDLAVAQFQAAKGELTAMDELKKEIVYELASCFEAMGKGDDAIAEYKIIYAEDIGFRDVADKINHYYAAR
ncbi:MAG TPA: tetratricopeptide repeat protein [Opitutaceae bacterium]